MKNNNTSQQSTSSQHNLYIDLDPEADLSSDESFQQNVSSHSRKNATTTSKPPPITVKGKMYGQIIDYLKKVKDMFTLKLNPDGIQISPVNTNAPKGIKKILAENHLKYFTHPLREEQLSKFVLHGFYDTPEIHLGGFLMQLQLNPVKIKKK